MSRPHLTTLLAALAAVALTSPTFAQESASARHDLGRGEALIIETTFSVSDYYETRFVVRSNTEDWVARSEMGTTSATGYAFTRRPDGFELRFSCGNRFEPEHQVCVERWVRRGSRYEVTQREVSSPWASATAELERALHHGRLGDARALLGVMGTTPNGGHTDESASLFASFIAATARVAERHANEGRTETAAALVLQLWRDPPLVTTSRASGRWVCRDGRVHDAHQEVSSEQACGAGGGNVWPTTLLERLVSHMAASTFTQARTLA